MAPISRLWKTHKLDKLTQDFKTEEGKDESVLLKFKPRGSSNALPKKRDLAYKSPLKMDYVSVC